MFIYDQVGLDSVARNGYFQKQFSCYKHLNLVFFKDPQNPIRKQQGQAECHLENWRSVSKPCSAIQAAEQLEEALTNSRPGLVQFSQYSVVLFNLCHDTINLTGVLDTHS